MMQAGKWIKNHAHRLGMEGKVITIHSDSQALVKSMLQGETRSDLVELTVKSLNEAVDTSKAKEIKIEWVNGHASSI